MSIQSPSSGDSSNNIQKTPTTEELSSSPLSKSPSTPITPVTPAKNLPIPTPLPDASAAQSLDQRNVAALSGKHKEGRTIKKMKKVKEDVIKQSDVQRELQAKSEMIKLKQATSHISEASSLHRKLFEGEKFVESQNPVRKIGGVQFVPANDLMDLTDEVSQKKMFENVTAVILKYQRNMAAEVFEEVKPYLKNFINYCDYNLQGALEVLEEDLNSLQKNRATDLHITQLIADLGQVEVTPALNLEECRKFYSKDEILSQLRLQILHISPEEGEFDEDANTEINSLLNAIRYVESQKGAFIDQRDITPEISGINLRIQLRNLTPFISTAEFLVVNDNSAEALEAVKSISKQRGLHDLHFVVKTGLENIREQLAGKLLTTMDLSKPLAVKSNISLMGLNLNKKENPEGIGSKFLEGSRRYYSKAWSHYLQAKCAYLSSLHSTKVAIYNANIEIEELTHKISSNLNEYFEIKERLNSEKLKLQEEIGKLQNEKKKLKQYLGSIRNKTKVDEVRQQIILKKQSLNTVLENIKTHETASQARVAKLNQELEGLNLEKANFELDMNFRKEVFEVAKSQLLASENETAKLDIQTHVLTDLITCSADSHEDQYLKTEEGHVINIDFARFLPPSQTFLHSGGVRAALRTSLIAHPSSEQPLALELQDKVLDWDLEQLETQWREEDLIGDPKEFRDARFTLGKIRVGLHRLKEEINSDTLTQEQKNIILFRLCQEYDFEISASAITSDFEGVKNRLINHLNKEYEDTQKVCFAKIHPEAFIAFKKRVMVLKDYIQHCQASNKPPTLKESFQLLYPELNTCMQIAERVSPSYADQLSKQNLEEIFLEATKRDLVTNSERVEMRNAISALKKTAVRPEEMFTTMS